MVQVNGAPMRGQWGLEGPNIYVYVRLGIDPMLQDGGRAVQRILAGRVSREREPDAALLPEPAEARRAVGCHPRDMPINQGAIPIFALGTLYTPDLINSLEEDLAIAEKAAPCCPR